MSRSVAPTPRVSIITPVVPSSLPCSWPLYSPGLANRSPQPAEVQTLLGAPLSQDPTPAFPANVTPTALGSRTHLLFAKTSASCFCQKISFPGLSHHPLSYNPSRLPPHRSFQMSLTGQSHFILQITSQLCFYFMVFLIV